MDPPTTRRLLDRVRDRIWLKQYTFRTEQAHLDGIERVIHFYGKRPNCLINNLSEIDSLPQK